MFTKIYSNLQQAFQLSWFKFLFWNTSLAKLIVQEEKPSAWDFFNTYLSSWWWTRLWFRAFIRNKKHLTEFDQIIKSLQILKNAGIFNEDNFNLILNHANLSDLAATLLALQDTRILLQDNFTLLANQAHPNIMASALSTLHQADILTPKNQAIVATDPREWDFILILLNNRGMLTPNNFNLIANHANPRNLAMALSDLQEAGILTPENQAMVTAHANPVHLATAFYFLNHTRILTPENRAIVVAHANPRDLAYALCNLQRAGILTPENRAIVVAHANPRDLASALLQLTQRHIRFIVKPNAIILETNEAYLSSKDFVPSSIHHMLIPKEHHLEREKYLNRIIAFFLNKTLKSLPLDVVAYILEFVEEMPLYRSEAMEVIQHVQLPKNIDLNVYKNDLKNKTQKYTQFEAELCHLKICKQNLLLKLDNFSFWANRHSCPEAQHVFDRQYGLVIGA